MSRDVRGWSGRQRVQFPAPMGPRWVYFVVDIPDYFLQPLYFNTPTVEFKIGSELDSLNRCLSLVRLIRESLGFSTLRRFLPLARSFVNVASLFGTSQGGVIVEVSGRDSQGNPRKLALCVFAAGKGEIVPAILPSVATQMILAGEFQRPGIVSHVDWLPMQRLRHELCLRDVEIAFRADGSADWSVLPAAAA